MSKEIDDKVVSLEFDNSKFEEPAKQSMSTLDKLKASFNFKGVSNGFDALNRAIRNVTFRPLENGIDTVYAKFTMMERFTIQLYDRMANSIINTGKKIVNETFVSPIRSGKSEYELKMGSIQTIMASTGESLDVVNQKLNELNKYSDDTIYSFQDMTNNIGKFTNAGVKLEDAVAAIKGVANEAALSGATANEASRAMYNFSQALSSGYVKLIDWKSIENANMATKSFKEELLKTAAAMGTVTDAGNGYYKTAKGKMVSATQGFNDSLQDAWMTSAVLTKTLGDYADETTEIGKKAKAAATELKTFSMMVDTLKEALQSGWAETWENIIGNFEEAKELWTAVSTELSGFIDNINNARNNLLAFWKASGGRAAMLKGFAQLWRNLKDIVYAVKQAFRSVFPAKTESTLLRVTKNFERLTRILKPTNQALDRIRRTFAGFFSILGIVKDALVAFKNALFPVFAKLLPQGASSILGMSSSLGDMIVKLRTTIKEGKFFEKFFGRVARIFEALVNAFKKVYSVIKDIINAFKADGITGMFKAMGDGFMSIVKSMWDYVKNLHILDSIKNLGKQMADAIGAWPILNRLKELATEVKNWITSTSVFKYCTEVWESFVEAIQAIINKFKKVDTKPVGEFNDNVTKKFSAIDKIKNFFVKVWDGIISVFEKVAPFFRNVGGQIAGALKQVFDGIKNVFEKSDLGDAGVMFAGAGIGSVLFTMAGFIKNLSGSVKSGGKFLKTAVDVLSQVKSVLSAMTAEIRAKAIKTIATSILMLSGALFVLAAIPTDAITKATAAIMALFRGLVSTMTSFSNIKGFGDKDGIAGVVMSMGAQIMMIAVAVGILVANIAILAFIPYEAMVKGIAVIVLLMRAITREMISLRESEGADVKMAGTLIAFGLALKAIAKAMAVLAAIDKFAPGSLLKVTGSIAIVIGSLAVAMALMERVQGKHKVSPFPILAMIFAVQQITLALIALSATLSLMEHPERMDTAFGYITKALLLIGGIMVAVVGFTTAFGRMGGTVTPAAFLAIGAMLIPVTAMLMSIIASLLILTWLPSEGLTAAAEAVGMVLTTFTLVLIGVAAIVAAGKKDGGKMEKSLKITIKNIIPLVSTMLILSAAVVAISAAAIVASKASPEGLAFVGQVLMGIIGTVLVIAALMGKFKKFADGMGMLVKMVDTLMVSFGIFSAGILALVISMKMLSGFTGEEVDNIGRNLGKLADTIVSHGDKVAQAVGKLAGMIIESFLFTLGGMVGSFIRGGLDIIIETLDGLIAKGPEMIAKVLQLVLMVLYGVEKKVDEIVEAAVRVIIKVVKALGDAIEKHQNEIVDAVYNLLDAVSSVISRFLGRLLGYNGVELNKFVNEWKDAIKAIAAIVGGVAIINKIVGFAKSVANGLSMATNAVKNLSSSLWYAKTAIAEYGSATAAMNAGMMTGASKAAQFALAIAKWAKPALIAIGVTKGLSLIVDAMADDIKVVSDADAEISETYRKANSMEVAYQKTIAKRRDTAAALDVEADKNQKLLNQLRTMVGQNDRVKAGYEEQVRQLLPQINEALGVQWDIENNRVIEIGKENEQLDIQSKKYDEIIKKQRLQRQLESMQEEYDEAQKQIASGDAIIAKGRAADQVEADRAALEEAYERRAKAKEEYERVQAEYDAMSRSEQGKYRNKKELIDAKEAYDIANEAAADMQLQTDADQRVLDELTKQYDMYQTTIKEFDTAQQALIEGNMDAIYRSIIVLSSGMNTTTKDIYAQTSEYEAAASKWEEIQKRYEEAGEEIPEEVRKRNELELQYRREYLKELGVVIDETNSTINKETKTATSNADKNGGFIVAGAMEGMAKRFPGYKKQVESIFGLPYDTVVSKFQIGSPSKVMRKLFGYVMDGGILGVEDGAPELQKSMETAAQATLYAYDTILKDPKNRPTIVPMYDTSAIQNGSNFGKFDRTLDIGSVSAKLAASVDVDGITKANQATVEELTALRGEVQSLKGVIGNLKVYMNGKALVGQIASDMDAALGAKTVMKGKGV